MAIISAYAILLYKLLQENKSYFFKKRLHDSDVCILAILFECFAHFHYAERIIIIINNMPCFQIDMEDVFHSDKRSFYPEPCDDTPCNLPTLKEDVCPETRLNIPVNVEKKMEKSVSMIRKTLF